MKRNIKTVIHSLFFFGAAALFCTKLAAFPFSMDAAKLNYHQFIEQNPETKQTIQMALTQFSLQELTKQELQKFSLENLRFEELKGGMTSTKLYTFEMLGKKYILRMLNLKNNLENRQNEIAAQKIGAELGIAAEIKYVDNDKTLMIVSYIEGHTLTRKDLENEQVLTSIGEILAKLHRYKGGFSGTRTQIERARKHYERALGKEIAFPKEFKKHYEVYIKQGKLLEKTDQVLTHADLNPANIIMTPDNKIYLIDWTSATRDNKFAELGYFTFTNGLSDTQSKTFLTAYFGREPSSKEWKQFKLGQKRTSFLTSIVWFDFSESSQEKSILLSERSKKLDTLLQSDVLKLGQDYIAEEKIISTQTGNPEEIKLYALGFLKTYLKWKD